MLTHMQEPNYSSYIELSRENLKNNIAYIRKNFLPEGSKLSCVVKGNAYGHGYQQIIQTHIKENKINHFCVYSAYEAWQIKHSIHQEITIVVMGDMPQQYMVWAIENEVEFYVSDTVHLEQLIQVVDQCHKKARIHIEVETGMNRTGFLYRNFKNCLKLLENNTEKIKVVGLCTHYAGAESVANHIRVKKQITRYKKFKELVENSSLKIEQFHTACSAASLRFKTTRMDMIRIGILQYGFWPNQETYIYCRTKYKFQENPLKRVITWKSQVMSIKSVKAGDYVGYANAYFANEDKLIAVIPVGYANGYSRSLSNQARVLINGEYAQVTGIVNMNAISVDVTHIGDVKIGDEVVLIGSQGDREVSVSSFSEFTDQLNYEVLTRLPVDIPRFLVD
jgi:alanine racemase